MGLFRSSVRESRELVRNIREAAEATDELASKSAALFRPRGVVGRTGPLQKDAGGGVALGPSGGVPVTSGGGFGMSGMGDGRGLVLDAWGRPVHAGPAPVGLGGGGGGMGFGGGGSGPVSSHPSGGGGRVGAAGTNPSLDTTSAHTGGMTNSGNPDNYSGGGGKSLALQTEQTRLLRDIRHAIVNNDGGAGLRQRGLL